MTRDSATPTGRQTKIEIAYRDDDGSVKKRSVSAVVYGYWAAHQTLGYAHGRWVRRPWWSVTHVPSGMSAASSIDNAPKAESLALKLAAEFNLESADALEKLAKGPAARIKRLIGEAVAP